MDRSKDVDEGMKAYHEALRFDRIAVTREDHVYVEESYWTAYRLLKGSSDPERKALCRTILHRIARILEAEGRHKEARDLISE